MSRNALSRASTPRPLARALAGFVGVIGVVVALAIATLLSSCTAGDPSGEFLGVQREVSDRAGHPVDVRWNEDPADDAATRQTVQRLLHRGPLDAQTAAQIAVLNNRSLQAGFEEIGIAHAAYLQAGLLGNPEFSTSLRFPGAAPYATDAEYALAANILDLFLLPARRKVAARELERAKFRVAGQVLELIADTRAAMYTLEARQQLQERLRETSRTNAAAAELARRLHDAGNISDLDFNNQEAPALQAETDAMQTQVRIRSDRERLNRLMSLDGADASAWHAASSLPPIPAHEPSTKDLESVAAAHRVDIAAARTNVDAIGQALALKTNTRYLPANITLGIDTERDTGRQHVTGPTLDLQLPIFDQGQGAIAKLAAQYRQARRELEAAEINARSQVREARALVASSRALAQRYSAIVLPQRRLITRQTQLQYNAMERGGFDLLNAREQELDAERASLEAWRDYWISRVELERAVTGGGNAELGGGASGDSLRMEPAGITSGSASSRPAAAKGMGE